MLVHWLKIPLVSHAPAVCVANYFKIHNDMSGEAMCCIHSKVVEDYQKDLHPGAVLILRQVSLLYARLVHVCFFMYALLWLYSIIMCMCEV